MEHYIASDNVCAWPNLTKLPDGAIVATIFNQPCHGRIVTAWYNSAAPGMHERYHMGAAVWTLETGTE